MDFEAYKAAKSEAGDEGSMWGDILRNNIGSARNVAQGVSLGYSDEAEAALRSGFGMFTDYEALRDEIRQEQAQWQSANPWMAIGTEVGGAAATGVLGIGKHVLGKAIQSGAPHLMKVLGLAATEGAVSGYGHSQSDTPEGELYDTLEGGAAGLAAGAAGTAVVKAGGAIGRNITKDKRMENAALKKINKALKNGGMTDADAAVGKLGNLGDDAVIADLPGVDAKFRPAALDAGEAQVTAKKFLRERADARPQKMRDMGTEVTGIDATPLQYSKVLAAKRRAEANVNYSQVMQQPVDITEPILRTIDTGAGNKAFKFAADDWYRETGERVTKKNAEDMTDLNFWNMYQSHLGDAARAEGKKINSNPKRMRGLLGSREQVLQELDAQVPEWKPVRHIYATQMRVENAVEMGRKAIENTKLDPADMMDDMAKMGGDERKAFLKGVMGAVETKIRAAPDSANTALNILRRPGLRERIVVAFGDDHRAASNFMARLKQHAKQGESESGVLYGSRTAPMQNELNASGQALSGALDLAGGNYRGALDRARSAIPTSIDHAGNKVFVDQVLQGGDAGEEIIREAMRRRSMLPGLAPAASAGGYGIEER